MFKTKKKLIELENRLILLERCVSSSKTSKNPDPVDEMSYKEIIDEWLNGKKSTH
jgi:hypothetical protein